MSTVLRNGKSFHIFVDKSALDRKMEPIELLKWEKTLLYSILSVNKCALYWIISFTFSIRAVDLQGVNSRLVVVAALATNHANRPCKKFSLLRKERKRKKESEGDLKALFDFELDIAINFAGPYTLLRRTKVLPVHIWARPGSSTRS